MHRARRAFDDVKNPKKKKKGKGKGKAAPKKKKGTTLRLPQELDGEGKLTGEGKLLNESLTQAIVADEEEKAAKTRCTLAKGLLQKWAFKQFVQF